MTLNDRGGCSQVSVRQVAMPFARFGSYVTRIGRKLRTGLYLAIRRLKRRRLTFSKALSRRRALLWQRLYRLRYQVLVWNSRHGAAAVFVVLLLSILVSALFVPTLQDNLEPYFIDGARLGSLRSFFLALGGALIGAAAIVSALVLFALQVNVERMPHGLFRRLSADLRLLSTFAGTFLLAIAVTSLALMPDGGWIGASVFASFWATILILLLFLYGFRRALRLINPAQQLGLLVATARKQMRAWVRRSRRAAPLFPGQDVPPSARPHVPQHDLQRVAYYQANPHWTEGAKQAVGYAISLARRYAEQGDHEASAVAMNAVVAINAAYIEAKGRTFFTYQFMFEHPLTSDAFINDTLEHLRQSTRIGLSRGDEQQIEQTLRAMAALVRLYATINYVSEGASKTHAHLAAAYLSGEVERIVPHNMPDVLMEGLRLMGRSADVLLAAEGPRGIKTLAEKVGLISCSGVAKEDYRPVTSAGVEQLARLSFDLLRVRSDVHSVRFAARDIRKSMELIATLFLALPDSPLVNITRTYLAPYYSATSPQSLTIQLAELVNAVAGAGADDGNARQAIDNLREWADGIYATEKETLLRAIARRSQFTFDMIHWITHVTSALLAVSNAPACSVHTRDELRRHALWLISVLSFVPDDEETVRFVENFQMTEVLFESAMDAHNRGCEDVADDIGDLLLSWTIKGGGFQTGWAILERGICGLATLALLRGDGDNVLAHLRAKLARRLADGALPNQGIRDNAARELRGRAGALFRARYGGFAIERWMARADHARLAPLLEELADLISPGTAGEAARANFY